MSQQITISTSEEHKASYIDGFVFPVPHKHLQEYKNVAEAVAEIWKEHGALNYFEYVLDDVKMEGTRSFPEFVDAKDDESIVFGWVVFESRKARDQANDLVAADPRVAELVGSITAPSKSIFDGRRMIYGGFQPLVVPQEKLSK